MHPNDEEARLDALYRLNLLDTAPSESFDRITRMAAQIFDLPIAAVSLTDRDRQWFKSRVGVSHWSIPRDKAPCAQVTERGETVLIPDLRADIRYRMSVLADQGVRFYAGASLTTREGHSLGALCVLGTVPRQATDQEMASLNDLAKMVMRRSNCSMRSAGSIRSAACPTGPSSSTIWRTWGATIRESGGSPCLSISLATSS